MNEWVIGDGQYHQSLAPFVKILFTFAITHFVASLFTLPPCSAAFFFRASVAARKKELLGREQEMEICKDVKSVARWGWRKLAPIFVQKYLLSWNERKRRPTLLQIHCAKVGLTNSDVQLSSILVKWLYSNVREHFGVKHFFASTQAIYCAYFGVKSSYLLAVIKSSTTNFKNIFYLSEFG